MKKEQKNGFGVVGIIIVIAVVAVLGGFFGYQYLKLQKTQEEATTPATESSTPPSAKIKSQTDEIDTSNWKTYRNEKYGFEVRYPQRFTYTPPWVSEDTSNVYLGSMSDKSRVLENGEFPAVPTMSINISKRPIEDIIYPGFIVTWSGEKPKIIVVDRATSYTFEGADNPCNYDAVHIPLKDSTLILSFSKCDNDPIQAYKEDILSTFKFTQLEK